MIYFHRGDIAVGGEDHLSCGSPFQILEDTNWKMRVQVGKQSYSAELDEPVTQGTGITLHPEHPKAD